MTQHLTRRTLLAAAAGLATAPFWTGPKAHAAPTPKLEGDLAWYDAADWGVEGRGFSDVERYYDRLPGRAEGVVRDKVWELSRHSTGMSARFVSDATRLHVRYKVMSPSLAMPHMPATGVSGVDFYATDDQGVSRWLSVVKPSNQTMNVKVIDGIKPARRTFTMYLPLFNGTDQLEVGLPRDALFEPVAPRKEKTIVFYGTSIMHGACASRPGMSISNILGRRLDCPTINLAFSGNGTMETTVGQFLIELDPAVYVIDCLPNMGASTVAARCVPLVRQIRQARGDVPIVLVEDRMNTNAVFLPSRYAHHVASRKALREAYAALKQQGVKNLLYLPGDHLLGNDGEASTDGSHPSDLGMVRYADAYEPVLREALSLS